MAVSFCPSQVEPSFVGSEELSTTERQMVAVHAVLFLARKCGDKWDGMIDVEHWVRFTEMDHCDLNPLYLRPFSYNNPFVTQACIKAVHALVQGSYFKWVEGKELREFVVTQRFIDFCKPYAKIPQAA
jgi:hypothetical protein